MNVMKKMGMTFLVCIVMLLLCRCTDNPILPQRYDIVTQNPPRATANQIDLPLSQGKLFQLSMRMGHDASSCNGCVLVNGNLIHVNCRGAGDKCSVMSAVIVTPTSSLTSFAPFQDSLHVYKVTSVPTALLDSLNNVYDDFVFDTCFVFPARSFWCSGVNIQPNAHWMNIPEQFIKRNPIDGLLYYDGVSFSAIPIYEQ